MPWSKDLGHCDPSARQTIRGYGHAFFWFLVWGLGVTLIYTLGYTRGLDIDWQPYILIRTVVWGFAAISTIVGAFRCVAYLRHDR